ncbi:MAG TPA: hypothetical protein VF133_06545 [Terriglobales bacterium]
MRRIQLIFASIIALVLVPGVILAQDDGRYTILTAQYGTAERHVDVTDRIREIARSDRSFRLDNRLMGVDPDRGRVKVLRIYARERDGDERMFEYREGQVIDGSLFVGWGRGDWGRGGWSGRWDAARSQPNMEATLQHLRAAQESLQNAAANKGGHRERALQLIQQAIQETQAGIEYGNRHDR